MSRPVFIDNPLLKGYHLADYHRMDYSLSVMRLSAISIALVLVLLTQGALSSFAREGDFPKKGSYEVWLSANRLCSEGVALREKGRAKEAIAKYRQAIKTYPYDAGYYSNLAIALKKDGDLKGAEEAARKSIALDSYRWNSWNTLANTLYQLDRLADSKAAFSKALRLDPPSKNRAEIVHAIEVLDQKIKTSVGSRP